MNKDYEIQLFANQKAIKIGDTEENFEENKQHFRGYMTYAVHFLSPNAFKLWLYIYNHYTTEEYYPFSSKDACKWCGFCRKTLYSAFNELIEVHYLWQSKEDENYYLFNPFLRFEMIDSDFGKENRNRKWHKECFK